MQDIKQQNAKIKAILNKVMCHFQASKKLWVSRRKLLYPLLYALCIHNVFRCLLEHSGVQNKECFLMGELNRTEPRLLHLHLLYLAIILAI
jgi:hypothetical protein